MVGSGWNIGAAGTLFVCGLMLGACVETSGRAAEPKPAKSSECAGLGEAACEHFVLLECDAYRKLADRALMKPQECKDALEGLAELREVPVELRMAEAVARLTEVLRAADGVSERDLARAASQTTRGLPGAPPVTF